MKNLEDVEDTIQPIAPATIVRYSDGRIGLDDMNGQEIIMEALDWINVLKEMMNILRASR